MTKIQNKQRRWVYLVMWGFLWIASINIFYFYRFKYYINGYLDLIDTIYQWVMVIIFVGISILFMLEHNKLLRLIDNNGIKKKPK